MRTAEFEYDLPPEFIAQTPVEPRDSSRLMVLDRAAGRLEHRIFRDIGEYLRPGDLLVLNDTRVIPARLYARKVGTGGLVEVLLLEEQQEGTWLGLVGGRRVRPGTQLQLLDAAGATTDVAAQVTRSLPGGQRLVTFSRPANDWLRDLGHTPLPPYIHNYQGDPERYQTIYARHDGSAAAPTAGLHFTPELLLSLRERSVGLTYLTLRIGLDTFKPIDEAEIADHAIHSEWARLSQPAARQINETRLAGGRIIAVGTTVVRTLETAALRALPAGCDPASCGWAAVAAFDGPTDLYITPGFRFQAVDALITNFHLPRSTLLVLVSAFAGALGPARPPEPASEISRAGLDLIKHAYQVALERRYRFYSFGDAMLIL